MSEDHNTKKAFFALLSAGLWEKEIQLVPYCQIDFSEVLRLAEKQSVVGLVTAGFEHVIGMKPAEKDVLQFSDQTVQMEQDNIAMNYFIGVLVDEMRKKGINTLLVKGQGLAQCYERPLWRSSGDVDFLLDKENYQKAREFLLPLSSRRKREERYSQHLGIIIDPWYVEIHGTLRTGLSTRVDKMVDAVMDDVLKNCHVRTWMNDDTQVLLPAPDNDVFLVFTHFIKHFYKGGACLRQVCDWARLLWTYRLVLDVALQERWLRRAGLVDEWQMFASLAVDWLGMPEEAMPLYDTCYRNKASCLTELILRGYSGSKMKDTYRIAKIFPWKVFLYSLSIFGNLNWLKVKERLM